MLPDNIYILGQCHPKANSCKYFHNISGCCNVFVWVNISLIIQEIYFRCAPCNRKLVFNVNIYRSRLMYKITFYWFEQITTFLDKTTNFSVCPFTFFLSVGSRREIFIEFLWIKGLLCWQPSQVNNMIPPTLIEVLVSQLSRLSETVLFREDGWVLMRK